MPSSNTKSNTTTSDSEAPQAPAQAPGIFGTVQVGEANTVPQVRRGRQASGPGPEVLFARSLLEQSAASGLAKSISGVTSANRETYARYFRQASEIEPKMDIRTVLDKTNNVLYVGTKEVVDKLLPQKQAS